MIKLYTLFTLCSALCFLSSCNSYKNVPYFQNINRTADTRETIGNFTPLTIQNSDILSVIVTSDSENPLAFKDSSNRAIGYMVDQNGEIKLPLIQEKVKVAGLTTAVAADQIKNKLTTKLTNPSVNVRMISFKIAVFGDVGKPDVFKIVNERVTLPEALSMAGDLNITARRTDILLIREIDGKREFIPLDLTRSAIFTSPYYYLKNNDVIYVQPDKTKYATVDGSYRNWSLILSGLSIVAIILSNALN